MSARLSVASILAESARRHPTKVALVLGDVRLDYATVWGMSKRYAAVLAADGIGPGSRVAIMIPNIPHFAFAYYGALALGASVVPVHSLLKAEEVAYALTDSGSSALITAAPLLGEAAKGAELAGVRLYSVLDSDADLSEVARIDNLAMQVEPIAALLPREPHDEAVILYTSGTTGKPKGAVLTHSNIMWNVNVSAFDSVRLQEDDIALGALPLFHSFGQTVVLNATFRVGGTVVLMPRFDGAAALALMKKEGITVVAGVPTMYMALLGAAAEAGDPPAIRLAVSGGAAIPVAVIEKVKAVFGCDVYEGYGLSETSPVATFNQEVFGRKVGSIGCPIWGVDVAICNADLEGAIELLPANTNGEIVIRGHNVFSGYLNKPDATAAVMVDGWFRTGDIGYVDDGGFFFIVDRKKDLIIRGGFNVYPREVEEVMAQNPAVAQVAVVGIKDEHYGEEIHAVVVLGTGQNVTAEELLEWTKAKVGMHKYPRHVHLVDELPTGPSGKVLKRVIVEELA
ncbi:MAG: long-chain fatty acid--CoA ligase [Actinomycetota bacterium]|nr:long-chain fatty acid--CoA ligase [Actinomycetota bacterium]